MRMHPLFINVAAAVAQNKNVPPHEHNFRFWPGMGGKTGNLVEFEESIFKKSRVKT